MEIDIEYAPDLIGRKRYYQFTTIDCASRWWHLEIYDDMGNGHAIDFVVKLLNHAPFRIRAIKADNDSCFTNRYAGYQKSANPLNHRLHPLDLFLM